MMESKIVYGPYLTPEPQVGSIENLTFSIGERYGLDGVLKFYHATKTISLLAAIEIFFQGKGCYEKLSEGKFEEAAIQAGITLGAAAVSVGVGYVAGRIDTVKDRLMYGQRNVYTQVTNYLS